MPPSDLIRNALREVPSYHDLRLQWIHQIEVRPAPNSVRLSFATEWPSAPLIEVFNGRPFSSANTVAVLFPLFYGWKTGHRARIAGLEQRSTYWYRVTAGTENPKDRPAVVSGKFVTGERDATVDVEFVDVDQSGDQGDPIFNPRGAAEWAIYFYVFGKAAGTVLAGARRPAKDFVTVRRGDRLSHPFGASPFVIPRAPDDLRLWAQVYEEDISDVDLGFTGPGTAGTLYDMPMPAVGERGSSDSGEWASALVDATLADYTSIDSRTFDLDTRPGHLSYVLRARLHTTVRNPEPSIWPPVDRARIRAGVVLERFGTSVPIGGDTKKALSLNWGVDRQLYYRETDTGRPESEATSGWRRLDGEVAGPVRALAAAGGRFDLVAGDPAGGALLASIGADGTSPKWRRAGGHVVASLTAARASSGDLHLVGLTREGVVEHGVVPRRGAARWRALRGREFGTCVTMAEVRGAVEVFAASARGEIFRRRAAGEDEWTPLGTIEGLVSLAAQLAEEGRKLVLLAFTAERRVFSKVWDGRAWDTPPGKWTALGLLDEIDRPAPDAARGAGSRQRARRPDRARRKE